MPRPSSRARGTRLEGFAPVIDARVETLILGSFPSEASLAAGQYYAHPRNQFWTILGRVLGEPLADLPYEARLARVLAHRIGIWDVLGACERAGSADSAIRAREPNDFARLHRLAPRLERVVFNGQTAGRFEPLLRQAGFATAVAPSTSPAHAGRTLAQKLVLWRRALAPHRRG
ncbi:MAG: DNA-deoxyinosine glycosylase [Burkholderiaceae bacterium]